MKNLMVFLSPHKSFTNDRWGKESEALIKIQIDNSQLFWKREDIILVTNFPYEYGGVKAIEIGDEHYCELRPTATKVPAILELFRRGLIEEGELYWFHDLDAFQLAPVIVDFSEDMGVTNYGITTIRQSYNNRLSTGSWFFKSTAEDIFQMIHERMYEDEINEETALGRLIKDNPMLTKRINLVDISYNVATRKRDVEKTLKQAIKPIKVLHFHPFDKRKLWNGKTNMEYCQSLMTLELNNIFKKHGL